MTGLDAHKNDFSKTIVYLESFVQHGNGRSQNIFAFNSQGSGGGRHRRRFGHGVRGRGGRNCREGRSRHGGSGGRGAKPNISSRQYINQEWALLSCDKKGKVFTLSDKYEPRNTNAVKISESSITKITTIVSVQNSCSAAAGEIESPGNHMTGKTCGIT